EFLGFTDFIPPFANTNGSNISHGVNYASGSAGISFETAKHMGDNVPLRLQLIHHNIIVSKIALMLGGFTCCWGKKTCDSWSWPNSLKLRALVDRFNTEKPDSKYIFVNSTAGSVDASL
ncbi:GDSL esterase/lipase, partial [Trifolium pratense]